MSNGKSNEKIKSNQNIMKMKTIYENETWRLTKRNNINLTNNKVVLSTKVETTGVTCEAKFRIVLKKMSSHLEKKIKIF